MNERVIFDGRKFRVTSGFLGLYYRVEDKVAKESVFVQGDDAADFREEWRIAEEMNPDRMIDDILSEITGEWSIDIWRGE